MKSIYPVAGLLIAASTFALAQTSHTATKPPASSAPAASAPAAKAAPTTPPPRTDANCLLVSNIFAQQSTDPAQKTHAGNVLFYYFGRLDARTNEAQMKAELKQAGSFPFTGATAAALMNNCVANMQARAQVLQNAQQQVEQGK
ncbi:MAG TPA: hypothetical protein VE968_00680 [Sphingomicrobium sp.]|nr:hypothetical protein [Sphingomicrobium sp.]